MVEIVDNIDQLHVGDFIKVVQMDGPVFERLNCAGKIIQLFKSTDRFEVHTMEGIVGLGMDMDDIIVEITKLKQRPNGWKEFKKNSTKSAPAPLKPKRERVYDLVKDNPRKRFPGLLSLAKKTIGGDDSMLTNYIRLSMSKIR